MKKYIIIFLVLLSLVPSLAFSQTNKIDYSGLVQCDGVTVGKNIEPDRQRVCDFNALVLMIKYIINWLFIITIPIATASFAYAGILYMTGKSGNIETAKNIFSSVAKGFIIMLIAWYAVVTVVNWFVEKNSGANSLVNIK